MKKILSAFLITGLFFVSACGDVVPPGVAVIIVSTNGDTQIVKEGVYKAWGRDRAYFVDGRLKAFTEKMQVLCADDINMAIDVKTLVSFRTDKDSIEMIKAKVQPSGDSLLMGTFYAIAVKDIVRSLSRNVISPYITDNIRPNRQKIEADISTAVKSRVAELKYPIMVSAVMLSNIDYPNTVKDMRNEIKQVQLSEEKADAQAKAELAKAKREVAVEQEKAKVELIKAKAVADRNRIIGRTLTPEYLAYTQLQVMQDMANGPNNTTFLMPYNAMSSDILNTAMLTSELRKMGK